jgi:hypothetical protein
MLPPELACQLWLAGKDAEHLDMLPSSPVILYGSAQTLDRSPGRSEVPRTDVSLWCGKPGSLTG